MAARTAGRQARVGDNVEDLIGALRYALLVAAATACASLAHALAAWSLGRLRL